MSEQREPGWYWVNGTPRRWCETGWEFPGHARLLPDAGMEIGPRILPPSAAPSQPPQKDLVAETVLHAEPGQPSNPAVARLIKTARMKAYLDAMGCCTPEPGEAWSRCAIKAGERIWDRINFLGNLAGPPTVTKALVDAFSAGKAGAAPPTGPTNERAQ